MRRRRWLWLIVVIAALIAACIRVQHVRIGWGEYWSVGFVLPWNR